jgi:hypothetical protein
LRRALTYVDDNARAAQQTMDRRVNAHGIITVTCAEAWRPVRACSLSVPREEDH